MKKRRIQFVLVGALSLLSITIQSCKKGCWICTSPNGTESVKCRNEYTTQQEFNQAIKVQEDNGWTCTKGSD